MAMSMAYASQWIRQISDVTISKLELSRCATFWKNPGWIALLRTLSHRTLVTFLWRFEQQSFDCVHNFAYVFQCAGAASLEITWKLVWASCKEYKLMWNRIRCEVDSETFPSFSEQTQRYFLSAFWHCKNDIVRSAATTQLKPIHRKFEAGVDHLEPRT